MKKIFSAIWRETKGFFINQFWRSKAILSIIVLTLILNGLIWFLYIKNYQDLIGITQIGYALAVMILNIYLANIVYRRVMLASLVLLSTGLIVQIIFLIFLKLFALSQS